VSALGRRLEVLERSAGAGCPKCVGVLATFVNRELRKVTRRGEPMVAAEWAEFEAVGSRCATCGAGFLEIRVPPGISGR
jgi:bacterioferritin-associated ferredoxin